MKRKNSLLVFLLLLNFHWIVFSSCSKETSITKPQVPEVEIVHLGTHDSEDDRILVIGEAVHAEANITSPGLIEKITLELFQQSGYATYSFKEEYTDSTYVGLSEVEGFHTHPTLPEEAPVGDYLFRLTVTDQQGQKGSIEENVTVKAADGETGTGHVHEE